MPVLMLSWLSIAALAQGGADEVARQAARISAADHREAFDAVSRLADLAQQSKPAVEAAAATLPDELRFYRDGLQEELRVREALGGRYPELKRRTFQFKDQSPLGAVNQVSAEFSEKVDLNLFRRGVAAAPFSLQLKDVPFMEALEGISRQTKLGLFVNGFQLSLNPMMPSIGSIAYRNFLVLIEGANRNRRIEFGAGETKSLQFWLRLVADSNVKLLRVSRLKLVEALDGEGGAIRELPAPRAEDSHSGVPEKNASPQVFLFAPVVPDQMILTLALPKSETVARLRGWYEVVVGGDSSVFEFVDLATPKKKADDFFEVEVSRTLAEKLQKVTVLVTPKGGVEAFLKMH